MGGNFPQSRRSPLRGISRNDRLNMIGEGGPKYAFNSFCGELVSELIRVRVVSIHSQLAGMMARINRQKIEVRP
jgi:hypothetical protein